MAGCVDVNRPSVVPLCGGEASADAVRDGGRGEDLREVDWREVPITHIEMDTEQCRRDDTRRTDELQASIRLHGLLHPIIVQSTENGRYRLIAGARRLRAVRALGQATIPAYVMLIHTEAQRLSVQVVENVQRESLSPAERRDAYLKLRRLLHGSTKSASAVLGIHPASFRRSVRAAQETGRSASRLSFGQSLQAIERWAEVAPQLHPSKGRVLLAAAEHLVEALRCHVD